MPSKKTTQAAPPKAAKPHTFGRPRLNQHRLSFVAATRPTGHQAFQALPKPTGAAPYRLDIAELLPSQTVDAVTQHSRLVFHTAGDTGGINYAVPQERVAQCLEDDFFTAPADPSVNPLFFYVLGDCVYFNGQATEYYAQFYQPYEHYLGPIVAIPGNHDGDAISPETSLSAFVRNMCAPHPGAHSPDARDSPRTAMTQPNVFWTLTSPLVNVVGLYTNVPEGGAVHQDQADWLAGELRQLPKDVPIILMMHHPVYSGDDHHSGSRAIHDAIESAVLRAKRRPDLLLAGHVHNYQRFTRVVDGADVPYIVAGAGGYHNLHRVALVNGERVVVPTTLNQNGDDVTLEHYLDDRHGFLRVEVSDAYIMGKYYSVPRPQEPYTRGAVLEDTFRLDFRRRKLLR